MNRKIYSVEINYSVGHVDYIAIQANSYEDAFDKFRQYVSLSRDDIDIESLGADDFELMIDSRNMEVCNFCSYRNSSNTILSIIEIPFTEDNPYFYIGGYYDG